MSGRHIALTFTFTFTLTLALAFAPGVVRWDQNDLGDGNDEAIYLIELDGPARLLSHERLRRGIHG